jgi:phage terminase large subunit GpA-like protein
MYEAALDTPGPHYMHFPSAARAGYDNEYFKGLISERMEFHRRGGQTVIVWEQYYERNEPLDCRNYARAAYRYFHWRFDELERVITGDEEPVKIQTRRQVERREKRHIVSKGITV